MISVGVGATKHINAWLKERLKLIRLPLRCNTMPHKPAHACENKIPLLRLEEHAKLQPYDSEITSSTVNRSTSTNEYTRNVLQ